VSLARRLERAEGATNAAFVEAHARLAPAVGSVWRDFDGTYAMYDGAESPLTQTFGLGLFAPVTNDLLDDIEYFYSRRHAPVLHETCPFADADVLTMLPERGYRPIEQTSVLHIALDAPFAEELTAYTPSHTPIHPLTVRRMERGEEQAWTDASVAGWGSTPELAEFIGDFGIVCVNSTDTYAFFVESDGVAIATGALAIHGGIGLLAGASTRPEWRGRGAQSTLLLARLQFARAQGCDVAMMGAMPGSGSQRNAERQGFRVAYTRTKWWKGARA
jgi:GNAT superfamily N-acetyltransferase